MRETNMRKLNRLVHSTSPGQRRCRHPCNSQPRTVRSLSNWNSNLEGLTTSSQVLLPSCWCTVPPSAPPRLEEEKGEERKEEVVFWTSPAGARPGGGACQCWRRIPPPLLLLNSPFRPQEANFVLASPGAS